MGGRIIGYARVSTADQDLDSQRLALKAEGCDVLYEDIVSGARTERPGLDACLGEVGDGDTLIVWRLDRLGRSLIHLVQVVNDLKERGVAFKSISEGVIDTTTPAGQLVFHIFAAMAQFERELIRERTRAGLEAARARGKVGGRPAITANDPRVRMAKVLHADKSMTIDEICEQLDVSRATFYRYLKL